MQAITVAEIERDVAGWLRRVADGQEFCIMTGNRVVAEVKTVRPAERKPRQFGAYPGKYPVPDDFDDPLPPGVFS